MKLIRPDARSAVPISEPVRFSIAVRFVLVALPILPLLIGCSRQEQIHSYDVPKEPAPPAAAATTAPASPAPKQPSAPTDRMLAAVLPAGDRAWFLKVTGPISDMEPLAKTIDEFFHSLSAKPGDAKPSWKLPQGWTESPGTGMRAATINIPSGDRTHELSVIALPWSGDDGELLSNVNRWRGQMSLPEINQTALDETTRSVKVGDATMTIVDLSGNFAAGAMTPPFAGAGPTSPGARPALPNASTPAPSSSSPADLPPGHPPIDPAETVASPVPLTFTTPKGWQTLPAGGMRKAAFGIIDGDQKALVTVIDFPVNAGPLMADPLENINRWRREVGLAEIDKDALNDHSETIEIGTHPAIYVEMIPDSEKQSQSQADLATAAAMVTAGDQIWFFKLTGSRDLVSRERENFKTFLKSVKFAAP